MIKVIVSLFIVFGLTGCANLSPRPPAPPPLNLNPADYIEGKEFVKADHQLIITAADKTHTILLHTEMNADAVHMVGFGPLGEPLFECNNYQGEIKCLKMADEIPAENLVFDLQTAFIPLDGLAHQAPLEFSVEQDADIRTLYYKGALWSEIRYEDQNIWEAPITIKNNFYRYTLVLKPLSINRESHA